MPSNYTGVPANGADDSPTIPCPVDGDPRTAASVNGALQVLADYVALQNNCWHPSVVGAGQARVLVRAIDDAGGGVKARIYLNASGELEITENAAWNPATSKWLSDGWSAGMSPSAFRLAFSRTGLTLYVYGDPANDLTDPANAWVNSAWADNTRLKANGLLRFFGTIAGGYDNSNPGATEAQVNTICAKNTPKAWGTVHIHAGTASLEDGFNVATVARVDESVLITLASPMQNASYAVIVSDAKNSAGGLGGSTVPPSVASKTAASGAGGNAATVVFYQGVTISTGDHGFDFVVFGRQDS